MANLWKDNDKDSENILPSFVDYSKSFSLQNVLLFLLLE